MQTESGKCEGEDWPTGKYSAMVDQSFERPSVELVEKTHLITLQTRPEEPHEGSILTSEKTDVSFQSYKDIDVDSVENPLLYVSQMSSSKSEGDDPPTSKHNAVANQSHEYLEMRLLEKTLLPKQQAKPGLKLLELTPDTESRAKMLLQWAPNTKITTVDNLQGRLNGANPQSFSPDGKSRVYFDGVLLTSLHHDTTRDDLMAVLRAVALNLRAGGFLLTVTSQPEELRACARETAFGELAMRLDELHEDELGTDMTAGSCTARRRLLAAVTLYKKGRVISGRGELTCQEKYCLLNHYYT